MRLAIQLLICLFYLPIYAAHIIGGDITYKCIDLDTDLSETTFEITVIMYRDSRGTGADFDSPARFGLFRGSGQNWSFVNQYNIRHEPKNNLTFTEDPCVIIPPNVGVESAKYVFQVTLPWSNENYKIAYQRCCRNGTITNLVDPGGTGAVFEIDFTPEAQRSCNNSPVFNSFPPIVLCQNTRLEVDLSATDADGDQIFYEFCLPKASGGQDPGTGCTAIFPRPDDCLPPFQSAVYRLPTYSVTSPLGTNSISTLDPNTGKLVVNPALRGQFVIGVCIKEFRNGQLLSEVSRDFQFNVVECEALVQASIDTKAERTQITNDGTNVMVTSCSNRTILFNNSSTASNGVPDFLWKFSNLNDTIVTTDRDALITFPSDGRYDGILIVNPSSGQCSDTIFIDLEIFPETVADFTFDYDTCIAGPVSFIDLSYTGSKQITDWKWSLSDRDSSFTQNPIYSYKRPGIQNVSLEVIDINTCRDTMHKEVSWTPVPDIILVEPSEYRGCAPATIFFNNLSSPINEDYKVIWNFGDNETSELLSPSHTFVEAGTYDISLNIISPEGCETSDTFLRLIEVQPAPKAAFVSSPELFTNYQNTVSFTDTSQFITGWHWFFGDGNISFEENPIHEYQDTGLYTVMMIGYHPLGCIDTAIHVIDIAPSTTLFMPDAFTPNNDGLNDQFEPQGNLLGVHDYHLRVYDRWGGLIYESEDLSKGWTGQINQHFAPQGVYAFDVSYKEARGNQKSIKGLITLIR